MTKIYFQSLFAQNGLPKKLIVSFLWLLLFTNIFSQSTEINKKILKGKWILTRVDANNSFRELDSQEKEKLRLDYLQDLPLDCSSLTFTGNSYTLIHHQNVETIGTWKLDGDTLTITGNLPPREVCSECKAHPREFIIRKLDATSLRLDYAEEDRVRRTYFMELTFTKQP